jgi:hypothetical protein
MSEADDWRTMGSARYMVVSGSVSAHCCFMASVVERSDPETAVCECFEVSDAERIAAALNFATAVTTPFPLPTPPKGE